MQKDRGYPPKAESPAFWPTLKRMAKSPPGAEEKIGRSNFADFLIHFRAKIGIPVLMPRRLTIGRTSKISIFQRKTGRWIVDWHDEHGGRRNPSFATPKEAEAFQKQKRGTRAAPGSLPNLSEAILNSSEAAGAE
jgi:hypothetical protein